MMDEEPAGRDKGAAGVPRDWKLRLRYGRLTTPYKHFTVLADGVVGDLAEGFTCPPGKAWMRMKVWAGSTDEAADMIFVIGGQVGFEVTGQTLVYDTDPSEPPAERPSGYDIGFTPYAE